MKSRYLQGIFLAVSLLLAASTVIAEIGSKGVIHTVFLWLKNPGDDRQRTQLIRATERLRTIPGIVELRLGEAVASDRDIVDDSFDVGIYFYFSDLAAMQRYLVHPTHKAVVERDIRPVVDRIVVHDFEDAVIE